MGLLNQVGRLGKKPKGTIIKDTKSDELIQELELDDTKVKEMLELGFRKKQIIENYVKIKHLLELYDNGFRVTIFPKEKLKKTIENCNGEINCIINELNQKINIDNYSIGVQALIMSILNK